MMREPELKPKMPQKRPLDILFVEDNTADVDLSLREFKKAELEVHADVVQTAQEFVERLSAKAYDVVLADYRLPGWTGMDALELLRQQGKEIPFILVTGALGEEMAVECIKRGVADYILKDRLVRLPVAVCRVLEEKYLRDARLWAETVLQESKARFRTLTETIASAIFIHQGTECRYVNRAAEAITGYSREELLAMSSWDLVHPDSRKLVMEQGLARLRGEQTPGRFEIKILTKQGEARWLDVTVAMIEYSGRPAGLLKGRFHPGGLCVDRGGHQNGTGPNNEKLFRHRLSLLSEFWNQPDGEGPAVLADQHIGPDGALYSRHVNF